MIYYFPTPYQVSAMHDTRNILGNAAGRKLFLSEQDSDVSVNVEFGEEQWHFPAHRLILSAMSDIFQKMFSIDMIEKTTGVVTITDHKPLIVKKFLEYLYIGVADFKGWTETLDLMRIAHKYHVQTLVALCEAHLVTVISFSNACCLYEEAETHSLHTLKKKASNFILEAAFIVTATEGFANLLPKSLEFFLSSPKLNMENELSVLTTLKDWAVLECCRRGIPLTHENVLSVMEPYMKHIEWKLVPEHLEMFVPQALVKKFKERRMLQRKTFAISPLLQNHTSILKFVVELGAFYDTRNYDCEGLNCLRFSVDNHAYVVGFRIVGMFRLNSLIELGPSTLSLARDDNRGLTQYNLNSLPWNKGSVVGNYIWREMLAYLPYPVRLNPFMIYNINIKHFKRSDSSLTKWPVTRLDSTAVTTDLGPINFHAYSDCYGITQLLLLPAPPIRNVCNDMCS